MVHLGAQHPTLKSLWLRLVGSVWMMGVFNIILVLASIGSIVLKLFWKGFWGSFGQASFLKGLVIERILISILLTTLTLLVVLESLNHPRDHFLTSYMTGTACTNDFKSKFGPEVSNKCDFCDANDSRAHRVFDCKHLNKTRVGKSRFLTWLKQQPEATKNLMLFEQNWSFLKVLHQHQLAWPVFNAPSIEEHCRYIFCDGSAYWQDQPCCTISGIGVIESWWLEHRHTVLFQASAARARP